MKVTLKEDTNTVVYGPYDFNVRFPAYPVFIDTFSTAVHPIMQQKSLFQYPDVYPASTSISLKLQDGSALPPKTFQFDALTRTV